jgi:hypothetical protein
MLAPSEARIVGSLDKEVKFDIVAQWVIAVGESPT